MPVSERHVLGSPLDRAYTRATGARPIEGNHVALLKDAAQNYPAWLKAIRAARRTIHFESYIVHNDDVGREFAEALAERARAGVRVRVLYDWWGTFGLGARLLWRTVRRAGGEARPVNPPRVWSPFGWVSRDHRKALTVDGRLAFVSGLCVGRCWVGDPARGVEPWRDTGIGLEGPAVAAVERAFAAIWAECGPPLAPDEIPRTEDLAKAGSHTVRVVASVPSMAGLYRLDQLIASVACETLWLTDAYFIATTPYVQGLCAAAADGVDVRLLVPRSSDVPGVSALSRGGYRALLEGGVRVFEWNGSMLHAKTAVADGRWARVGSTNLNPVSWLGNWELDVAIEDESFASGLEEMYLDDLTNATEIVLSSRKRVLPIDHPRRPLRRRFRRGSASRAAAGAIGVGSAVGAAITSRRALGPAEARLLGFVALLLVGIASLGLVKPLVVTVPVAVVLLWIALALVIRAWRLHRLKE
jgi:cardiolipin synthase